MERCEKCGQLIKRPRQIKPYANPRIEEVIVQLERYCDEERGRQRQVARALTVSPSQVARWIQRGGTPRLKTFVELIEFLERQGIPPEHRGGSGN